MSARLDSHQETFAKLPKGIFDQFERRLEAAGFTPSLVRYFVQHPDDLPALVDAAERIREEATYLPPILFVLSQDHVTPVETDVDVDGPPIEVRIRENVVDGQLRIVVFKFSTQKMWEVSISDDGWTRLAPDFQIRHDEGNHFYIRRLRPGR